MSSESLHDPEDYANWRESWLGSETEQLERAAIFRLAGSLRSKRILEIGCGDGTYSIAASLSAAQVTAVDISAEMLSSARRRADERGAIVDWCQASGEQLPFQSNVFEIVLAVTSLCFVRDAQRAVDEAARVLRPGGLLVIGELGKFNWWALSRTVRGWFGSARWRRARFWSLGNLRRLVVEAGLVFHSGQAGIYYPPMTRIAKVMISYEDRISVFGQIGAAFLTVRAAKPGLGLSAVGAPKLIG